MKSQMLIGRSMGGLAVQLLLQTDLATAGIAIDSAPPMGVFTTKWSFLKSNWPYITPFVSQSSPIDMTFLNAFSTRSSIRCHWRNNERLTRQTWCLNPAVFPATH